jgi:hypothetical protein
MPTSNPASPTPAHSVPPAPPVHVPVRPLPQASLLLTYVHAKFRQVLGEPFSTLELDSQWSLRSRPQAPAIFVLVNGSYEKPAVWIFDPYAADNVWRTSVTCEGDVDGALGEIGRRTAFAAVTDSRA